MRARYVAQAAIVSVAVIDGDPGVDRNRRVEAPVFQVLVPGDKIIGGAVLAERARPEQEDIRPDQRLGDVQDPRMGDEVPGERLLEMEIPRRLRQLLVSDAGLKLVEGLARFSP